VIALVVIVAAFTFAYRTFHHYAGPADETPTPSVVPTPIPPLTGDPRITASVPVPNGSISGGIAVGSGSVWVGLFSQEQGGPNEVMRIDLATNAILGEIPVQKTPPRGEIAATDGAVWVASSGLLERIDPSTNEIIARVPIPVGQVTIAADASDVWAAVLTDPSPGGILVRVDARTNQVVAEVPLGSGITGFEDQVRLGAGSVWVLASTAHDSGNAESGGDLVRIDPSTNEVVARVPIGGFNMVVAQDAVWVHFPADGVNDTYGEKWLWSRVSLQTNQPSAPFALDSRGLKIVTPEALWSVDYGPRDGFVYVTRLNPDTLEVAARSAPITSPFTDAVLDPASGTVWVSAIHRIVRVDIS